MQEAIFSMKYVYVNDIIAVQKSKLSKEIFELGLVRNKSVKF